MTEPDTMPAAVELLCTVGWPYRKVDRCATVKLTTTTERSIADMGHLQLLSESVCRVLIEPEGLGGGMPDDAPEGDSEQLWQCPKCGEVRPDGECDLCFTWDGQKHQLSPSQTMQMICREIDDLKGDERGTCYADVTSRMIERLKQIKAEAQKPQIATS